MDGDVDSTIKLLAPKDVLTVDNSVMPNFDIVDISDDGDQVKSSTATEEKSLRTEIGTKKSGLDLHTHHSKNQPIPASKLVDPSILQRLQVQVRHLHLKNVSHNEVAIALHHSRNHIGEALEILMNGKDAFGLWPWEIEAKALLTRQREEQEKSYDTVAPEAISKVLQLLQKERASHSSETVTPLPEHKEIIAALQHTGGHVLKAVSRLNDVAVTKSLLRQDATPNAKQDMNPNTVDKTTSQMPKAPAFDDVTVTKVISMVSENGQECTFEAANAALHAVGGHIGKAFNNIIRVGYAQDQVLKNDEKLTSEFSLQDKKATAESEILDKFKSKNNAQHHLGRGESTQDDQKSDIDLGNGITANLSVGAFDATDVTTVINKLKDRGIQCTEKDALDTLQKVGGHVGKAINSIVSQSKFVASTSNNIEEMLDKAPLPDVVAENGGSSIEQDPINMDVIATGILENLSSKGVKCTRDQVIQVLHDSAGDVRRATNRLVSQMI